jgi:hypothetical protein
MKLGPSRNSGPRPQTMAARRDGWWYRRQLPPIPLYKLATLDLPCVVTRAARRRFHRCARGPAPDRILSHG